MAFTETQVLDAAKTSSVEHVDSEQEDQVENGTQADKFGSIAKTDPKEIALVKKLDLYMMVRTDMHSLSLAVVVVSNNATL